MARRVANDPAFALERLGLEKLVLAGFGLSVGQQSGEVVLENERLGVGGVGLAVSASVAGAKVAGRVVCWTVVLRLIFVLALPRTLGAVRRNQYPVAVEEVKAAMRGVHGDG